MKERIILLGLFLTIFTTFAIVLIVETATSGSTSSIDKYSYTSSGPLRIHLVGDFGELRNDKKLDDGTWAVEHVAQKMKEVASERPIGFVMTAGDNRYNDVNDQFDEKIFKMMHDLFDDDTLAMKPWYVTLGNHDCYRSIDYELEMAKLYPMWNLPSAYYSFIQNIDNSKKVGFIILNGCDLACEDYEDYENAIEMCENMHDIPTQSKIDKQYDWLNSTLYNYSQDSSIVWTVVTIHMAPYTGGAADGDVEVLKKRLVPLLQSYHVDLLLTGHDHLMEHFYIPNSASESLSVKTANKKDDECELPYYNGGLTQTVTQKGEGLHQVIMGASGRELEDFCPTAYSDEATLLFGDVEYGFVELYINSDTIKVWYQNVDDEDPIFQVTIVNYNTVVSVDFEVFGRVQGVSFRKYTMLKAQELNITGWIQNTDRGTVIGTIQGPQDLIHHMKFWLSSEGSPNSSISNFVVHSEIHEDFPTYKEFKIRN